MDDEKPGAIKELSMLSSLSTNGKDLYGVQRGAIYKIDLGSGSAKKIDIDHQFEKNNRDEFEQMFYEVWSSLAENFYDPKYHGVDWDKTRDYYASFLPYITNRNDLRVMLGDLLGELNSSHLGFNSNGPEERRATSMLTDETGILFRNDQPYLVDRILPGSPADHVGQKVSPGDRLTAVNGVEVDTRRNRNEYFTSAVVRNEITMTFEGPGGRYDVTSHVCRAAAIRDLLYREWEDQCRERVDKATGGRVAYHHMRAMGNNDLDEFFISMYTDAVHKDALILDLRYNNGGNVHYEVLEFLARKGHFSMSFRDQERTLNPNISQGDKPLVVLINERSLSDAEVTSNGIKTLGLGKLVGTETYRWIIFTAGVTMVDGSTSRMPAWGCYNLDGEDLEFKGVAPDIYIRNTFEDRLKGNDPQLETAIREILSEL